MVAYVEPSKMKPSLALGWYSFTKRLYPLVLKLDFWKSKNILSKGLEASIADKLRPT